VVEPAAAAGVAAPARHGEQLPGRRAAMLLTGPSEPPPAENPQQLPAFHRQPTRTYRLPT